MFTETQLREAASYIYQHMSPTPQISWPQINQRVGCQVLVKHENHTPIGAFKARGGLTFARWLKKNHPDATGIVTATRGNHGQAQAFAATKAGIASVVVVPRGNSKEKNNAMRSFGAEVIEQGADFNEALLEVAKLAEQRNLFVVPPFHPQIMLGVASYALELFSAAPDLDRVYVPIGCGSGICGTITARDALGLKTEVIGVVSDQFPAAKTSFDSGSIVESGPGSSFADGMAVRVPVPDAFAIYSKGAKRIVSVSDEEVAEAARIYFSDTHNATEGAGAVTLAAALQERDQLEGMKIGIVLTGGNIDSSAFAQLLNGETPRG
ncbi:threonine dehydratase [Kiloniella laminariae]|uniref:Threonine dehydratase n=1 Tax=Kiloniella laminariae TaxID=454162 RepID=A0ABT4LNY0_9PROT|nr:threonine dehydratase [Kiloniella laminariae]MCZ4282806.1 threonine dehydratase [Kiloniella laminariae]